MIGRLRENWLLLLTGLFALALVLIESTHTGDFHIFLSASQDLIDGKNIYQVQYHGIYQLSHGLPKRDHHGLTISRLFGI